MQLIVILRPSPGLMFLHGLERVFAWRPSVIQIVKMTLGQRFEAITSEAM